MPADLRVSDHDLSVADAGDIRGRAAYFKEKPSVSFSYISAPATRRPDRQDRQNRALAHLVHGHDAASQRMIISWLSMCASWIDRSVISADSASAA